MIVFGIVATQRYSRFMFLHPTERPPPRASLRSLSPWIFILGLTAGALMPAPEFRAWLWSWVSGAGQSTAQSWPPRREPFPNRTGEYPRAESAERDAARLPDLQGVHAVDVTSVIDGDTFAGRVRLWPGMEMFTKVRLRGIDAAEMKASCAAEYQKAQSAREALRAMLAKGDVAIFNVGPDKYSGRVVADASTREIPNVSQALLAKGEVRPYTGGRRQSWCD